MKEQWIASSEVCQATQFNSEIAIIIISYFLLKRHSLNRVKKHSVSSHWMQDNKSPFCRYLGSTAKDIYMGKLFAKVAWVYIFFSCLQFQILRWLLVTSVFSVVSCQLSFISGEITKHSFAPMQVAKWRRETFLNNVKGREERGSPLGKCFCQSQWKQMLQQNRTPKDQAGAFFLCDKGWSKRISCI